MSKEIWIVTKTSIDQECWLQVPEIKIFNTYDQALAYYDETKPPQDEFNYVQTKRDSNSEFTYQVGGYCKGYSFAAKKPYGVKIEKSYI